MDLTKPALLELPRGRHWGQHGEIRLRPERGNPSLGSPPRGKEVKIEEVTLSLARKRPGNPEPDDVAPPRGIVPVAVRGTEEPRSVEPGTAPQEAL